jgi:transposase
MDTRQALKGPKRHQAVSGYGHIPIIIAHNHGVRSIDAIHNTLTGNPWLPTITTA